MAAIVSIIIPTYNRADRLGRALDSVRAQEVTPLEIIVVDDGSTDGTRELLEARYPGQILYLRQDNQGPSTARNLGMKHADGEFIAFLDSDDEWPAGSLKQRVDFLRSHPEVDAVFANFVNVVNGQPEAKTFFETKIMLGQLRPRTPEGNYYVPENVFDCLLVEPFIQTSTVVLRRSRLGPDDQFDERLWLGEDWEFWLHLSRTRRFAYTHTVASRRHVQNDNLTRPSIRGMESEALMWAKWLPAKGLTGPQRSLVRSRLAKCCQDIGYRKYWETAERNLACRLFLRSFRTRPSWAALKCLGYSWIPGFHHLKRTDQ